MSNPRTSIDTSGQIALQDIFAVVGDSADPTQWMREDDEWESKELDELISSGELGLESESPGC